MQWTAQMLAQFATADDLRVSPFYNDGQTCGTPTWIWSVVVANRLYARAWNGPQSSWYQAAIEQGGGWIHLAGKNFRVTFVSVNQRPDITTHVDAAYRQKYAGSPYLLPMLQAGPQAATVEIMPAN
ncbi:DUF2255 family protein [Levilactobacillus tujiorum]|uniref:DUF2255 family protein n=1 Tax=Levilactobacillus tujiorum TaxID=2912243 RepID=A0ABX1L429_9LACO|nr:DUF2255 family protein [Levilactobacillus tujiorum]MCH5465502.1 DUF2255 family protein [Levilactobacillus tujiorum]NLR12588.1 DUF2255 family protein [Lactobacillus sp. HBUAS51387]NLR29791.1 DUF2255 family protein [Levilactobacillus tujiorum]